MYSSRPIAAQNCIDDNLPTHFYTRILLGYRGIRIGEAKNPGPPRFDPISRRDRCLNILSELEVQGAELDSHHNTPRISAFRPREILPDIVSPLFDVVPAVAPHNIDDDATQISPGGAPTPLEWHGGQDVEFFKSWRVRKYRCCTGHFGAARFGISCRRFITY